MEVWEHVPQQKDMTLSRTTLISSSLVFLPRFLTLCWEFLDLGNSLTLLMFSERYKNDEGTVQCCPISALYTFGF